MDLSFFHLLPTQTYSNFHSQRFAIYFTAPKSVFKPNQINLRTPTSVSFSASNIPARDRVIDFGKYKGRMLGTLPSSYLKWVSKNLRARDFEEWAKLADKVLKDTVYRDRIEWEFAEKVLNGDVSSSTSLPSRSNQDAVSELLELSERFGWDNDDKAGWSRIDFGLLGTSKGGRIPRVSDGVERETSSKRGNAMSSEVKEAVSNGERRKERRDRLKAKRKSGGLQRRPPVESLTMSVIERKELDKDNGGVKTRIGRTEEAMSEWTAEIRSPFPGRESLIQKVMNRRKVV